MNKKVLTLCAGFMLGGSLAVVAENVQVKEASQLANGAKYKVVANTSKGDSIMTEGTQTFPLATGSGSYSAPQFLKRGVSSEQDSIWTLAKVDGGFQLKATTNAIRNGGDGDLYTNAGENVVTFAYNPTDGALTVDGDTVYVYGTGASYNKSRTASIGSKKFTLYLQENTVAENSLVEGSTQLDEISGAVFVLDSDGKYVGYKAPEAETKAIADGANLQSITAEEFLKLENKTPYVWKKSGNALESAYNAGVYLTVNTLGELTTTNKAANVSFANTVLTAGDNSASASIVSSTVLPPFNSNFFNGAADPKASKVVLYTSEKSLVVNADNELVNYDPSDAVETVWSLEAKEISKGKYELRFKDADGNYLTVGDEYVTVDESCVTWDEDKYQLTKNAGEVILKAGENYVAVENGALVANVGAHEATYFGLGAIDVARVNAATLLNRYGEYFTLDITYLKGKVGQTDLTSIFEGKLTPMKRVEYRPTGVTYTKATSEYDKEFMLVNEEGNILAVNMDEDDRLSEGAANHVYPLTTITPHEYALDQAQLDPAKRVYATLFYFDYEPGTAIENSSSVNITAIHALTDAGRHIELGAYLDKTVPTLVGADGVNLQDVTIELNKGTLVVAKEWLNQPAYYTVEVLNKAKYAQHKDQVLGLEEDGDIAYVAATKTDINRPEGQFAISYNEKTGNYDFTNRETGETAWSLMGNRLYKISSTEFAYLDGGHMDTLAIKPVTTYKSYDGFRRYSAADLNNNTYTVAMNLLDESFLYVVENHNDKHRIGLDREEATEWRIEIPTVKLLDAAGAQKALVADTVKVPATIKYWKDNTWVYTDDKVSKNVDGSYKYYDPNTVLEICTYILKNTDTDEYMMGSSDAEEEANAYYYCPSETQATRIALKLVGDSTVNLVPVYSNYWYEETDNYGNRWRVSFRNWNKDRSLNESQYNEYTSEPYSKLSLSENKIIGGTTSATGVLKDVALYQATSNDLFVIAPAEAPTYKKMEQGQKIVISREENNDEVIYEKGEFAGINNRVAYKDINPTLYVDTAYVNRDGNYRYEYLLGVNINRVDSIEDCNNPNHEHPRTVFTEGRFLVNMRDSADANTNVHNNKFEYDGESKLAFVAGYHQNDTLYITDEAGKVIAKSEVGNAAPHFAKFAFKMIDETNNEFVIEVGESAAKQSIYKNGMWQTVVNTEEASRGYLRWHNGNLVVTPYLDKAEHFTMEASDKEATANENIAAGNVVVAGVDGAVVVKGAEGKNVIVSTILGKVVANEVVSSDNATIAAPAGIVVVSVDGESFKVVVK